VATSLCATPSGDIGRGAAAIRRPFAGCWSAPLLREARSGGKTGVELSGILVSSSRMGSVACDQDGQRDLSAAFVVALAQHPEA
jgi:hypothetical protein